MTNSGVISCSCILALLVSTSGAAQTASSLDARVQAPLLGAPERGSIAGQLASVALGPTDVSRGGFGLSSPFALPSERGAPLAPLFPTYSPDAGLSEWGMGWSQTLSVTRWRARGELDFETDDLTGPWGRLTLGNDGDWYPAGLSSFTRVDVDGDTLRAYLADGSRWTFGGTARVVTSRGTYAWMLTEVVTAQGRKMQLEYAANDSGRQFLTGVEYGGVGDEFQYRVELSYESLPLPFLDARSGKLLSLDRRVREVTVLAKHASSGQWAERWRHALLYETGNLGPAFYLSEVSKNYPTGSAPPPTRYRYHLAGERLATTSPIRIPKLDAVVQDAHWDFAQPNRSSPLDLDLDGRIDLEHHVYFNVIVHGENGYTYEPLPPAPANANLDCRPAPSSTNAPRQLVRLRADDDTVHVVSLKALGGGASTSLAICTREGTTLSQQSLMGNWAPGSRVRVVDLDRDLQPDLLRVTAGRYTIRPNISNASQLGFGTEVTGELSPSFTPDTVWVHDMNGDGVADLISRTSNQLLVWFGLGGFRFEGTARPLPLRNAAGVQLTSLADWQLHFLDANKDGLADVLISRTNNNAFLLINSGTSLVETPIPSLASIGSSLSRAVIGDFSGSGNTEILYTSSTPARAYVAELDGPETGLLKSADDGRGTVLQFEYARAPASPGGRGRQSVLSRLETRSSGLDDFAVEYDYENPALHSDGKFLLGYRRVVRREPSASQTVDFLFDDAHAGLVLMSREHDGLSPQTDTFEARTYEDATFHGVSWKRIKDVVSGWTSTNNHQTSVVSERTETLGWIDGVCQSRTRKTNAHGTLVIDTTYVRPTLFAGHLSCLESGWVETGTHLDSSLNFRHETQLTRNPRGLIEQVRSIIPGGALTIQSITYGPTSRVERLAIPGRGESIFTHEPDRGLVRSVESPDGVVMEAVSYDPVTDALLTLRTSRGTRIYETYSRFDGEERLATQWDNVGVSTEWNPDIRLFYRYATATQPASITTNTLTDGNAGTSVDVVSLLTAGGEALTSASKTPEGWTFERILSRSRTTRETIAAVRPNLDAAVDVSDLGISSLMTGAHQLESSSASLHGHAVEATAALHANVIRRTTSSLMISSGLLLLSHKENGVNAHLSELDASKRVLATVDEAGTRHAFRYDALGRLREVYLPAGNTHRVDYDGHRRISRVARSGLATVEYHYANDTGLPASKRFLSSDNSLQRSVHWTYDLAGRVLNELYTETPSGKQSSFKHYYDGATPSIPGAKTELGRLTAVEGEGFVRTLEYDLAGRLTRRTLHFEHWRTIKTELTYTESGAISNQATRVYDSQGVLVSESVRQSDYDTWGRLTQVQLNSAPFASIDYDAHNRPHSVHFTSGDGAELLYDAFTRAPVGNSVTRTGQQGWTTWNTTRWGARGLPDSETYGLGSQAHVRQYSYSSRRLLTGAVDSQGTYTYDYDSASLPVHVNDASGTRSVIEGDRTLSLGNSLYTFDALGRAVQHDDLSLSYGAHGHIDSASRGTQTWTFLYDEAGQRILKMQNGSPIAAYLDEGHLDGSTLTERIDFGGQTVALLQNGALTPLALDPRGTVFADKDGTLNLASPYGNRISRPSTSAAIDYVTMGFDEDLGVVRMGVRDYDTHLNRFITPDPLFLESPQKCVTSPAECNLYSYAAGNPVLFTDPNGQEKLISTSGGKYLFTIDDGRKEVEHLTAKQLYRSGVQWMAPGAANYMPITHVSPDITQIEGIKHFSLDDIIGFALEKGHSMIDYAPKGSRDWKAHPQGADGGFLVTVNGRPMWADGVGQVPFAIAAFRFAVPGFVKTGEGADALNAAASDVRLLGYLFPDGYPGWDPSPSYDNHIIRETSEWMKGNYEARPWGWSALGVEEIKEISGTFSAKLFDRLSK